MDDPHRPGVVQTETGGPRVQPAKGPGGSGSKLVERSVTGHLKGSIDYDWADDGLIVTLKVNPDRLAA